MAIRARKKIIAFRVTPEQLAKVGEKAKAAGFSTVSDYARNRMLGSGSNRHQLKLSRKRKTGH